MRTIVMQIVDPTRRYHSTENLLYAHFKKGKLSGKKLRESSSARWKLTSKMIIAALTKPRKNMLIELA